MKEGINPDGNVVIPGREVPSFRTTLAIQAGVEKNILISTWGGIGDQICAEPTLRFALDTFKGANVSLVSEIPEFFKHLPFKEVLTPAEARERASEFFRFETIQPPASLVWEFMSHMIVNCIDFASLCAFRCQIPNRYKPVQLKPVEYAFERPRGFLSELFGSRYVVVHAGKHWPSKTFPKDWWDGVLSALMNESIVPVLIGDNCDDNRGTVNVDTAGCLDLRGRLSLMESVALLQLSPVLITNDSSPLHMAASGNAWIGYIATVKHPDYITHWRGPEGEFGWRMENLGLGGYWDVMSNLPNVEQEISLENVDEALLRSWLPDPKNVAQWAKKRLS